MLVAPLFSISINGWIYKQHVFYTSIQWILLVHKKKWNGDWHMLQHKWPLKTCKMRKARHKITCYVIQFIWNIKNSQYYSDSNLISDCLMLGAVLYKGTGFISKVFYDWLWWWLHAFIHILKPLNCIF